MSDSVSEPQHLPVPLRPHGPSRPLTPGENVWVLGNVKFAQV